MLFAQIGHISMSIEPEIENVLFELVKSIKVHKIDRDNTIFEVNYDKYVSEIVELFKKYE